MLPTAKEQSQFWSKWVEESRAWEKNPDNARRLEVVLTAVGQAAPPPARVLDVGCGTGWVSLELAKRGYQVTGTDLAVPTLRVLEQSHSQVRWVGGDFMQVGVGTDFDAIVCVQTIAHVPDQKSFAARLVDLLRPGGTLVLTSQNALVWNHSTSLKPPGPGQIRNWPSRARLRSLFGSRMAIRELTTCAPGGDMGWLRLVQNRVTRRTAEFVLGRARWQLLRERAGLGRSLVLVATSRPLPESSATPAVRVPTVTKLARSAASRSALISLLL